MPPARRSRTRGDRLTEEAILSAALRIVAEEGLAAVTMRRVAAELRTGAASLYFYVSGRDELCQAMLEHVAGQVPIVAPDPVRWREQLIALLDAMRRGLAAHPGLAGEALAHPPADERSLLLTEAILGLLRAGGVGDRAAAWAAGTLPAMAMAAAISADEESDGGEGFVALSAQRFPNIVQLSRPLAGGDAARRFRFAVEVFLDGLLVTPRE